MFTLVPSSFFNPAAERETLAEVGGLKEGSVVRHLDIPQYDAVLIYSDEDCAVSAKPEIYSILEKLPTCPEYNKILCSIKDGMLHLAIAQGKTLLLANAFKSQDFTTAEYYLFLAIRSLQINPEVSTVSWMNNLSAEQEMSLYRYFKAVDYICE